MLACPRRQIFYLKTLCASQWAGAKLKKKTSKVPRCYSKPVCHLFAGTDAKQHSTTILQPIRCAPDIEWEGLTLVQVIQAAHSCVRLLRAVSGVGTSTASPVLVRVVERGESTAYTQELVAIMIGYEKQWVSSNTYAEAQKSPCFICKYIHVM